jgi:lysophospholipase L1-like esterase
LAAILVLAAVGADASQLVTNLEAGKTQTVVTFGTSLTAGGAWVGQVKTALTNRYPGRVTVVNGAQSGMWSAWGVSNLETRVLARKPDTVFIEFAINDAFLKYATPVEAARKNLENMIDRIQAANPAAEIILMTMNPSVGGAGEKRPELDRYYEMYREVARARKLLLIDHHRAWKEILEKDRARFDRLAPDGLHPNANGAREVIVPAILRALGVPAASP